MRGEDDTRGCVGLGFAEDRAGSCARLFAETTRDGVYTHGINRFSRFVAMVRNGSIDVEAEPQLLARLGALERWDGCKGPGNLNAQANLGVLLFFQPAYAEAIPQYTVGHARRLEALARFEAARPGLYVGSSLVGGISVGDRIRLGASLAERVDAGLASVV